jgi:hypothetical protein
VGSDVELPLGPDIQWVVVEQRTPAEPRHIRHPIAYETIDRIRGLPDVVLQPPSEQPPGTSDPTCGK